MWKMLFLIISHSSRSLFLVFFDTFFNILFILCGYHLLTYILQPTTIFHYQTYYFNSCLCILCTYVCVFIMCVNSLVGNIKLKYRESKVIPPRLKANYRCLQNTLLILVCIIFTSLLHYIIILILILDNIILTKSAFSQNKNSISYLKKEMHAQI